jgi:hypothetical protein
MAAMVVASVVVAVVAMVAANVGVTVVRARPSRLPNILTK